MERTGQLYGAGRGMVVIIGIMLICSLIVSTLLRFTGITEDSVHWLLLFIAFLSFGIGGITAGVRSKEKGLITGLITAGGVLLVFTLFEYLGYDSTISGLQALYYAAFTACSVLGGIIGVNTVSR